jgi:RepB DNA-primase N-terminal domain/Primase C terminal 2 (PriCT-2)
MLDHSTLDRGQAERFLRLLDRGQAERFLRLLDPGATSFTFQLFDDNKERANAHAAANALRKQQGKAPLPSPFARILHGTLAQQWKVLAHLNAQGAGIYITVNQTNMRGRKAENIVRVRCLFLDLDGAPLPRGGPEPHIIVETSPGHWHVYWRVDGVSLDEFAGKQRALIALHGGDPVIVDLPRVMRLPGFFHCKREPQLVRLVSAVEAPSYPASDFPTLAGEPRQPSELTADDGYIARALAFVPNADVDWGEWRDIGYAIYGATSGSAAGLDMFVAWSKRSGKYDERGTLRAWDGFERSPPDRIGAGTIIYKAKQATPKWAALLDDGDAAAHAVVASFMEAMR